MLLILAGALVGALGFRLRGSSRFRQWTGRGLTTARLACWASPLALLTMAEQPWHWSLAIGAGLFAGSLPAWWHSLSLGRNPIDGPWHHAAARHTARGVVWGAGPALAVLAAGGAWWWPLVAGALVVAPYEAGWRLWPTRAVEVGECGFGAMMGAAVLASVA